MKTNEQTRFYENSWFCILMLILFAPVGIILLWRYKHFQKNISILLTVVSVVLFIFLLATMPEDDTPNEDIFTDTSNEITKTTATPSATASANIPSNTPWPTPQKTNAPTPTASIKYDKLQQLYLNIRPKMSYKKIIKLVKSTKLPYSEEKYNGSREIQVSYTKGGTAQKYKKENSDYLTIIFLYPENENSSNDILSKYTFGTCTYVPNDSSLELISHVSGDYFSYDEPGNYISDLGEPLDLKNDISKKEQIDYYLKNK